MNINILGNLFRNISFFLDKLVYGLIEIFYNLFVEISTKSIIGPDAMRDFAARVWAIIGVVMLFKITISLISMYANPDSFNDSKKGMGSILKRIFISLILLGTCSYIFQMAFRIQCIVINENILGNFILGSASADTKTYINDAGKNMAFDIFSGFFQYNGDSPDKEYEYIISAKDMNRVANILNNSSDDGYKYDYMPFISTIGGVVGALIILSFCFDIAIRTVKLAFLQLIAPIPIISYIQPGKGEKIFNGWVSECVSTYLSLFIRLLVIYFAVYIIAQLNGSSLFQYDTSGNLVAAGKSNNLLLKPFVIIGVLLFAKELPKLISDILGIKFDGNFTMNPFRKLQQVPLLGWGASQLAGRTAGTAAAAFHDQTGHRGRAALAGWWHAGQNLNGKVSLAGNKPGAAAVKSISLGHHAGFEIATGKKWAVHNPTDLIFKGKAMEERDEIKSEYINPLRNESNKISVKMSDLTKKYSAATTDAEKESIMKQYQSLSIYQAKIDSYIKVLEDQRNDIKRMYNIDESPTGKIKDAMEYANSLKGGNTTINNITNTINDNSASNNTINSQVNATTDGTSGNNVVSGNATQKQTIDVPDATISTNQKAAKDNTNQNK